MALTPRNLQQFYILLYLILCNVLLKTFCGWNTSTVKSYEKGGKIPKSYMFLCVPYAASLIVSFLDHLAVRVQCY